MPFLELKNIGKIYVSDNNVSVGVRGINLSFELGEFVAITGKSGSGKSTLLNVISGIDTYEEGEMNVLGKPTSYYLQSDFEEYRKKYISFVFQDYNIIDSFTVLENVELALMNIESLKERRQRALSLIEEVGLLSKIKTKGSLLSGGEKQRCVIARALAKDSPVILADEPTGNLDSETGREVIKLLKRVSNNKLVIIVTHNYDEVKDYATRHIRIHDGKVESDENISSYVKSEYIEEVNNDNSNKGNTKTKNVLKNSLLLGLSRFSSKPKLSLFTILLFFITTIVIVFITSNNDNAFLIFNKDYLFTPIEGRVIVSKMDGSLITNEEVEELATATNAKDYLLYDFILDYNEGVIQIDNNYETFNYENADSIKKVDLGRKPCKVNEVCISLPLYYKSIYSIDNIDKKVKILNTEFILTGISFYKDNTVKPKAYFTDDGLKLVTSIEYLSKYVSNVLVNYYSSTNSYNSLLNHLYIDTTLSENEYYVVDDKYNNYRAQDGNNGTITISIRKNINNMINVRNYSSSFGYIDLSYDLSSCVEVKDITKEKLNNIKGIITEEFLEYNEPVKALCISPDIIISVIYDNVFAKTYTQASLFYKNTSAAKSKLKTLQSLGYASVESHTIKQKEAVDALISGILSIIFFIGWFFLVFFLSLFIYLCLSKSLASIKNDLGIFRSMGIPKNVIKCSIYVSNFLSLLINFTLIALFLIVFYNVPALNNIFNYMHFAHYLAIILSLSLLTILVSKQFTKKVFKSSVKSTLKGERN